MSTRLNRIAYAMLIDEDLEWLLKQPRSLERDHIEAVLKKAVEYEYGPLYQTEQPIEQQRALTPGWFKHPDGFGI